MTAERFQTRSAGDWPTVERRQAIMREAQVVSAHVRINFQHRSWQGTAGNWTGAGTGSSIDFQDHRPYLPGDDPRYIDWAAYARSGHYIMKLYREEVSPRLELIVDISRSMTAHPQRCERMLALAMFCVESAVSAGASVRVYAVSGSHWKFWRVSGLRAEDWSCPEFETSGGVPDISLVPHMHGSMRIVISDLLFPQPPANLLRRLVSGRGRGVILCPWLESEMNPDWNGNVEFVDSEDGTSRRQRVTQEVIDRYQTAYRQHIGMWRDACRRFDVRMTRIACDLPLKDSLQAEAFTAGVIEAWN